MKNKAIISIAAVSLVLGIMLAIQFKTTANHQTGYIPARVEELTQKLNTVTEERDALAEEVVQLRERVSNFRETNEAMKDLQEDLEKARTIACLNAVKGPGIIVTLDDSTRTLQSGENPNNLLIHELDLLIVVNELRTSGAEAISINDERITALSEIRCAGTLILVNWNKIAPPFIIKAIGDPNKLESGMLIRGGHIETLRLLGNQATIQKSENIEIPGYSGRMAYRFAEPVKIKEEAGK